MFALEHSYEPSGRLLMYYQQGCFFASRGPAGDAFNRLRLDAGKVARFLPVKVNFAVGIGYIYRKPTNKGEKRAVLQLRTTFAGGLIIGIMHSYSIISIKTILCLVQIVFYPSFVVFGQQKDNLAFTYIQLPDIYSNRTTNDVLKDQQGVIWIGNNIGLFIYDGVQCLQFSNANIHPEQTGKVYRLAEDSDRNIWILAQNGLFILSEQRTRYLTPAEVGIPDALLNVPNLCICQGAEQEVFLLSNQDIYRYAQGALYHWAKYNTPVFQSNEKGKMLFSAQDQQIYLLYPEYLFQVFKRDGTVINSWKLNSRKNPSASPNLASIISTFTNALSDSVEVYGILEPTKINQLHINLSDSTFTLSFSDLRINGFTLKEIYTTFIAQERPDLNIYQFGQIGIYRIAPDIVALSSYEGILLIKLQKHKFKFFKESLGHRIRAIQEDAYGHIIFGSYDGTKYFHKAGGGLRRLSGTNLHAWNIVPLNNPRDRFAILGEDISNNLYFTKSSPEGVQIVRTLEDMGNDHLQSFNICVAPDESLNGIWHIINGEILSFYDFSSDKNIQFSPPLPEKWKRAMIKRGDIWIGGFQGLKQYAVSDFSSKQLKDISFTIPEQVRNLNINVLHQDSHNNLWIGTNAQGVFRYNITNGQIEQFTTEHGLPENSVFSILAEKGDSVLWLGTGKGLSRFSVRSRWFDNYFKEDGLSHNEFNTSSVFQAMDGIMYMGGQNGINYFHPDSFKTNSQPLKQFTLVRIISNAPLSAQQQFILSPGQGIVLQPEAQVVQFSFHTDDYAHANKLNFRYRISGFIKTWQYLSPTDKAIFSNLPSGVYDLEVQTQSYRGMWEKSVHYNLEILPYWYETWWFRSLVLLFILGTTYGLYLFRINQIRREFVLRQQISADLHDSLGSRIYLMRSLSQQIVNPLIKDHDKQVQLKKFEEISKDIYKSIRDFIWAFDPKLDGVLHLFGRLDDFAEDFIQPFTKQIHIDRQEVSDGIKVGPRIKHHVMSIYQELLTNMVKHTHCKEIRIRLALQDQKIIIQIQNRHEGYKKQDILKIHETDGKGRESIQLRVKEIRGAFHWQETSQTLQIATLIVPI